MDDSLKKLEAMLELVDTKSTMQEFMQAFGEVLTFVEAIKTGNEQERTQIQSKVESAMTAAVEKAQNRLLKTSQQEWDKVKAYVSSLKSGIDGAPGTPGLPGPKGESIKGEPGEAGAPGKDGSPDTSDEVVDKVNASQKLIKASKIEGMADIERMAKANSNFNPTMGPSFSDLRDIRQTVSDLSTTAKKVTINYIIDGGGSAITTGVKGFVEIPYGLTITGWQIFADQVGSIVIDVWKAPYASFPPTVGDTIAGSELPTLASAQSNQDLSLSTWTTSASGGDILAFNVQSVSTVTRITVSILATKN